MFQCPKCSPPAPLHSGSCPEVAFSESLSLTSLTTEVAPSLLLFLTLTFAFLYEHMPTWDTELLQYLLA